MEEVGYIVRRVGLWVRHIGPSGPLSDTDKDLGSCVEYIWVVIIVNKADHLDILIKK